MTSTRAAMAEGHANPFQTETPAFSPGLTSAATCIAAHHPTAGRGFGAAIAETAIAETAIAVASIATPAPPRTFLDVLLGEAGYFPGDAGFELLRRGLEALVAEALRTDTPESPLDRFAVDAMIAQIDARVGAQIDAVLHHPRFQALEATWRALKFLVDRVDFRENIKIDVLSASKDALRDDLEDAADVTKSGLFQLTYANEFGVLGGEPYGLICTTHAFGPGPEDMQLLARTAAVAAMAHAPLIANADARFFGLGSLADLPKVRDLEAMFDGPQYAAWRALRDTEDARYVGLCLPRFLLRAPYTERNTRSASFAYNEDPGASVDGFLWGPAAIALATRIADSFARYRWCPNIIGPRSGGSVDGLALPFDGNDDPFVSAMPTEALLTERREYELAEQGFIGMVHRKGSNSACFFSANSAQRTKHFLDDDDGRQSSMNARLGTQLPYMFIITRLSHYIKVLQREHIGSWKERADLEKELNRWIHQYVADMDDPAPGVRSRRPLRRARVCVEEVAGEAGWYRCAIEVQPHLKYMGASFTLSLVGRLDKM